jgi:uncharacterized protein (TIGR03790 family)
VRGRSFILILFFALAGPCFALDASNLVLITNKNVPESRKLAEFYAASRKVPDHRILELDLPGDEEISFDGFESKVIPAVREFLAKAELQGKVTCLVTFYGVPLRIAARVNTAADVAEVAALKKDEAAAIKRIAGIVELAENLARTVDPKFVTGKNQTLAGLIIRDRAARGVLARHAMGMSDPAEFKAFMDKVDALLAPLIGVAPPVQQRLQEMAAHASQWTPAQRQQAEAMRDQLLKMRGEFDDLQAHRADAAARAKLRVLVKEQIGMIEYANLLNGMLEYFATDATGAAFDSELALVNWNYYVRSRSIPNPLQFKMTPQNLPPIYMTCRLDAPGAETVKEMIRAGMKAEAEGLSGEVVVDAGGHLSIDSKNASYAAFDKTLQNLGEVVRTKTKLHLTLDEKRDVLPRASVKDPIAIYCGWYALQNYTQPGRFAPGAVGYHVASFELTLLHKPSRQWVRGLLEDGVAATLGAVAEPYLNAFPPPDQFFPLLFTGKLTLAEVYWKTNPMVSWQITMVGDPLYNPFKSRPALGVEGLSEELQAALKPAARRAVPGR